jgi:hypothetical protein
LRRRQIFSGAAGPREGAIPGLGRGRHPDRGRDRVRLGGDRIVQTGKEFGQAIARDGCGGDQGRVARDARGGRLNGTRALGHAPGKFRLEMGADVVAPSEARGVPAQTAERQHDGDTGRYREQTRA